MKNFKLIAIGFLLVAIFSGCNPAKRIQRIAQRHGLQLTDSVQVDTNVIVPGIKQDSNWLGELSRDSVGNYSDTTHLLLPDGTVLVITNTIDGSQLKGTPKKIKMKTGLLALRGERKIPVRYAIPYQKYVFEEPGCANLLIKNIKWVSLLVLGVVLLFFIIKTNSK